MFETVTNRQLERNSLQPSHIARHAITRDVADEKDGVFPQQRSGGQNLRTQLGGTAIRSLVGRTAMLLRRRGKEHADQEPLKPEQQLDRRRV